MDATHINLLLNHFPIIGTLIGAAVMLWGMMRNEKATLAVAAMTVVALPVYLGESSEERVEHLTGVSEAMIEEHEEAAQLAMLLVAMAGVASLTALVLQYRTRSKMPVAIAMLLTLLAFVAMSRVGFYGGQIRHSELRSNLQAKQQIEVPEYEEDD